MKKVYFVQAKKSTVDTCIVANSKKEVMDKMKSNPFWKENNLKVGRITQLGIVE